MGNDAGNDTHIIDLYENLYEKFLNNDQYFYYDIKIRNIEYLELLVKIAPFRSSYILEEYGFETDEKTNYKDTIYLLLKMHKNSLFKPFISAMSNIRNDFDNIKKDIKNNINASNEIENIGNWIKIKPLIFREALDEFIKIVKNNLISIKYS